MRRTRPREVWAPKDACVIAPRLIRMAATLCAAAGATIRTSTPKFGSAIVSSSGAALSSATHAARGRRCLPANRDVRPQAGAWMRTRFR